MVAHESRFFYSTSSISGVKVSILTTFPPSLVLIRVTPCVDLPRTLMSFTLSLIIVPVSVINITSSSSVAILAPTSFPVFGVIL